MHTRCGYSNSHQPYTGTTSRFRIDVFNPRQLELGFERLW
jgi:hypothetical protein